MGATPQNSTFTSKSSRLFILDLARCIAMIMMVQGHTIDALVHPQFLNTAEFPWNIWNFFRGLTAPIFLMVSGAVHVFAMKPDSTGRMGEETMIRRIRWALILLSVGYLLVFPANRIFDLPFLNYDSWKLFFQSNILQLVGVSLLLVVWLCRSFYSVRSLGIAALIITISIFMLTPFVHAIDWFQYLPEPVGAFLSYQHGSLFPIFPFAGFLFMGVSFGAYLKQVAPAERDNFLLKKSALIGLVILAVAGVLAFVLGQLPLPNHEFMMSNPAFMLIRVGIIFIFFSFTAWFHKKLYRFRELYAFLSAKSFHVYVLHLVIIYGTPWFSSFGRYYGKSQSLEVSALAALLIIAITLTTIYLVDYLQKNVNRAPEILRFSLGTMLAYALLR
ncbi:MAG: acyltransferase [Bacteroidetes bacterium]|nr:acyltransferase [Bacteroidota bacterium]